MMIDQTYVVIIFWFLAIEITTDMITNWNHVITKHIWQTLFWMMKNTWTIIFFFLFLINFWDHIPKKITYDWENINWFVTTTNHSFFLEWWIEHMHVVLVYFNIFWCEFVLWQLPIRVCKSRGRTTSSATFFVICEHHYVTCEHLRWYWFHIWEQPSFWGAVSTLYCWKNMGNNGFRNP